MTYSLEAVDFLHEPWTPACPHRFDIPWGGMSHLRVDLLATGMAYESDPGPWPRGPEWYDEQGGPDGEGDYTEQCYRWLAQAGTQERPGIAAHKFSSNDPWRVTDIEVRGALHVYDTLAELPEMPDPSGFCDESGWRRRNFEAFVAFLRANVGVGGLEAG